MKIQKLGQHLFVFLTFLVSASGVAGVIELNFPFGKETSCVVKARYWDGKQQAYTCSQTFRGNQSLGEWGKVACRNNQQILNLDHKDSRLDISSNGRCAKTYLTNLVGEFKVEKTAEKNVVKRGAWFLNGSAGKERKFINAIQPTNTKQPSWAALDLRHFSRSNVARIFINKEYAICFKENSRGCRHRDEVIYTQIDRVSSEQQINLGK